MKAVVPLLAALVLVGCEANDYGGPPPEVPPPQGVYPESVAYDQSPEVAIGAEDNQQYEDTDPSALTDFRAVLDPYGNWVQDPTYGTVWVPSVAAVGRDFVPYVTAGHWAYSDQYIWMSDYPWGWVPFHYGRWVFIAGTGWAWIPGRQYAGAWVEWRTGGAMYDYVGWAPLPPYWIWTGGIAVALGVVPHPRFVFCPGRDVFAPVIAHRIIRGPRVTVIASRTTPFVPAGPVIAGARRPLPGPSPARLNIPPAQVVRPTGREPNLVRAQQFSHPTTAIPLGARPPTVRPDVNRTPPVRPTPTPVTPSNPAVRQIPPPRAPARPPQPAPVYPTPIAPAPRPPAMPQPVPVQPMPQRPPPVAPPPRFTPPPAPPPPVAPPPVAPGAPHMPFPHR